jgi:hypothetical protein
MKKTILLIATAITLLTSCKKDEVIPPSNPNDITILDLNQVHIEAQPNMSLYVISNQTLLYKSTQYFEPTNIFDCVIKRGDTLKVGSFLPNNYVQWDNYLDVYINNQLVYSSDVDTNLIYIKPF